MPVAVSAQIPSAQQVASQMRVEWNLVNTLESICGETAWGRAITSQKLIDTVKAAGFNTVRLPISWFCHSDTVTSEIDPTWIARVKEAVGYYINDNLYVTINIHWDSGWLVNGINVNGSARVNERQHAYWTRIANYFKNYDEYLLLPVQMNQTTKKVRAGGLYLNPIYRHFYTIYWFCYR